MSAALLGSAIVHNQIGIVGRTPIATGRCLPRVGSTSISKPNPAQSLVCCSTSDAAADTQPEPSPHSSMQEKPPVEEPRAPGGDAPAIPPAVLRKAAAAGDAIEALDILAEGLPGGSLSDGDCRVIMAAALERGNAELAQSIFRAMTAAAAGTSSSVSSLMSVDSSTGAKGALSWPPATIETAAALVIGLCRALRIKEAVSVIGSVRSRGLPVTEDIQFGYVVECPLNATGKPLAVMQPQEGVRNIVDSFSRYEYELFSGNVVNVSSESLVAESSGLVPDLIGGLIKGNSFLQRWGVLWRPSAGAVHTIVVQTPAGQQRTFRFGTNTADVSARQNDRITVVCAPQTPVNKQIFGLLSSAPPETKPGEPLSLTNHTLEMSTQLARPPAAGMPGGIPNWVIPAAAALVAADAASSLVNPIFPYLVAGAVVSTAATAVAAQKVALPRLKQLPLSKVEIQATRQKLLGQHTVLERRVVELVRECEDDVRVLARLWQLQTKMGAVSGGGGTYDARMERISETRTAIEGRLGKRIEMVDAYAKVISMIEIEVEMETQLPDAEVEGIEVQIARLEEIEDLQAEYQIQAEAQDEVERLLRAAP